MINNNSGIIIILVTFFSKIIALLRDIFMSKAYGVSYVADAYNISYILMITIFGLIGTAITNAIVPTLSKVYSKSKNKNELFGFLNNVLNIMIIISILVTVISIFLSKYIVIVIGGGLQLKTLQLATKLVRIALISLIFLTLNSILNAILRVFNYYKMPVYASFILNIPALLYLIFFNYNGVYGLTVSLVIGYLMQCIVQIPSLIKEGYRYKLIIDFKDDNIRQIFKIIPPMLLSSGVLQISIMCDNRMASTLGDGGISSLSIASKVNSLVYTIFAASLIQISYTQMSKAYRENGINEVKNTMYVCINKLLFLTVPTMIGTVMLSKEIIYILFYRGEFGQEAVSMSSIVLMTYSIGLIFYIVRDIINYCFYAIDLEKVSIRIGIFAVIINIILNIIFTPMIGIAGIGLATSMSAMLAVFVLIYKLKREIGETRLLCRNDLKKLIISNICIVINIFIYKNIAMNINIYSFSILIIICAIEYIIMLYLLNKLENSVKEVDYENSSNGRQYKSGNWV